MRQFFLILKKIFFSFLQKKKDKEFNLKLEPGCSYRVYWKLSVDSKRLSEIDKTIRFFTGELQAVNTRKHGLILNPNERIYSFLRKGFDTNTGQKYIHKLDILESEIMKLEFVG